MSFATILSSSCATVVCLAVTCGISGAAEPTTKPRDNDILVGVNYFAGWWRELPNKWHGQGWKLGQPDWRRGFPERVPTLGEYNEQATMDREIIAASEHGVDFFAILWYYPKPDTKESENAPKLNRGLEHFVASPEAHRMRFCIDYCNSPQSYKTSSNPSQNTLHSDSRKRTAPHRRPSRSTLGTNSAKAESSHRPKAPAR